MKSKLHRKEDELTHVQDALSAIGNLDLVKTLLGAETKLKAEIRKMEKEMRQIELDKEPILVVTGDEYVLSVSEVENDDEIGILINKTLPKIEINDIFCDDDIPDNGVDHDCYWLVGSRLFKSVVHWDAEWVGDWSMRCNVLQSNSFDELSRVEIKDDFKILYNDGDIFNAEFYVSK